MINTTIPTNLDFPNRGVLERDDYVNAQETAQDLLAGAYTTALNQYATELNDTEADINLKWEQVQNQAVVGSYSQAYIDATFTPKVLNTQTDKITPIDADLIPLSDSTSSFGLKKLSWANIKATLKTYFDTLYMALTGDQTIDGVKTFSSSPIVPTPTAGTQAVNKDYVDSSARIGLIDYGYRAKPYHIVAFGGEFNRADYPKLWAYLQVNSNLVKTQAEWTIENTTNGMCGFFSDGNRATTFRVPNLDKAFLRPDSRTVGSFQEGSYAVGDSSGTTTAVDGLANYDDNDTAFRSRMNWDAITTVSIGAVNLRAGIAGANFGAFNYLSYPNEFGVTRPKNIAVLPLIVAN